VVDPSDPLLFSSTLFHNSKRKKKFAKSARAHETTNVRKK
jgi:hypothetical protein